MSAEQGLAGIVLLLGGAASLVSSVIGLASSTMDSGFGFALATGGVISMIVGYIMIQTN